MLTHANVVSNTFATVHHLRMTDADRGLCALPLFHCFGQTFIMNALQKDLRQPGRPAGVS
jgi:long-chain acyl-CoA synthetase